MIPARILEERSEILARHITCHPADLRGAWMHELDLAQKQRRELIYNGTHNS